MRVGPVQGFIAAGTIHRASHGIHMSPSLLIGCRVKALTNENPENVET